MMDLSDGLADDLPRLCAESGVGARVFARRLPVHPACLALASRLGKDSLALAITGGEDYHLLFTCPPDAVDALAAAVSSAAGAAVTVIGDVTGDRGVSFLDPDGRMIEPGAGFDHFAPKTYP
jgi:thiamine-monophosphate kinase